MLASTFRKRTLKLNPLQPLLVLQLQWEPRSQPESLMLHLVQSARRLQHRRNLVMELKTPLLALNLGLTIAELQQVSHLYYIQSQIVFL